MRKEILDALKAKFAGVSDSILGRIADKLAKTVTSTEQVAPAVEGVTIQQVVESYGDSRATEAQQTAVQNYETKHGLKDGLKVSAGGHQQQIEQPEKKEEKDEQPAWVKSILDANKALTDRLDKIDADRTISSRKQQLSAITGKLPEQLRKSYDRTSVDNLSDEQFANLLSDVTTEVDGIVTEVKSKGAVFGTPAGDAGNNHQKEELTKEQSEAIAKRTDVPKDGQPF